MKTHHVEQIRTRRLAEGGPYLRRRRRLGLKGPRRWSASTPCRDRVNADGHREILGLQVTPAEYGAGWLASFRDLTARGLCGAQLVTSDADTG